MKEVIISPILSGDAIPEIKGLIIRPEKVELGDLIKKAYELSLVITLPAKKKIIKTNRKGEEQRKETIITENFLLSISKRYHKNGNIIMSGSLGVLDGAEWNSAKFPHQRISFDLLRAVYEGKPIPSPSPAEVYRKVRNVFDYYLDAEPEVITLFSVYTIATYYHTLFSTFPYLYLWGARQSGKTKTLSLFQRLCFNAVATMNLTPSSLFRLTEVFNSTLCIDESEYLKDAERKSEIQTLLFAGYKRDSANVLRVEGEEKKNVRIYRVFSPKIMASINYPNDVLMDRCIMINMKRGSNKEKLNREPNSDLQEIRDEIYKLLFTRFDEVYELRDMDFENDLLVARERELWRPLLVIGWWIKTYMNEEEGKELWEHLTLMLEKDVEIKEALRIDTELNTLLYVLLIHVEEDGLISNRAIKEWILDEYRLDEAAYKAAQKTWSPEKIGRYMSSLGFQKVRRGEGTYYRVSVKRIKQLAEAYGVKAETSEGSEGSEGSSGEIQAKLT